MVQVYDDNYAAAFALESFYIQEAYNQHKILSTLNECVCIESGNIAGIEAINESLVDNVKNFFSRIWEFITKTFAKFRERMSELLTSDKAFLEKYKDIILKKPFKDHKLTDIYDYAGGTAEYNIEQISKGDFSFSRYDKDIDKYLEGNNNEFTEEAFIENVLKKAVNTLKTNDRDLSKITEINEYITVAVKGETRDMDINSLNKESLYKFCVNIDATNKQLEKNQATLKTSKDKIMSLVNTLASEAESNVSTAKANQNNQSNQEKQDKQETEESTSVYSNVYKKYITEFKDEKVKNNSSNSSSDGGTAMTGAVKSDDHDAANRISNNISNTQGQNGNQTLEDANKANNEAKRKVDAYRNFFQFSVSVQSSLMTVTMSVFKDYMKLLRIHVRDYVGKEQATDGTSNQQQPQQQSTEQQKEQKTGKRWIFPNPVKAIQNKISGNKNEDSK